MPAPSPSNAAATAPAAPGALIRCPQCAAGGLVRPFEREIPWLSRCPSCGLGFANPQPTDEELARIYDKHYYEQFGFLEHPGASHAGLALTKRLTYGLMLARAEKYAPEKGRLLDAGCGLGFSLVEGARRGWDVMGLDPLAGESESRSRLQPHPVCRGDLDGFRPERPFDLISLIDMIEHVRDPEKTIARALELLRPGGVLLVATNNLESGAAHRTGSRWVHFHRAHLWFFSHKTLARATENAGAKVLEVRRSWRVYNLDYVCGILARGDNFPLAQRISKWILRWIPRPLRLIPWPPLPEGMFLLARRTH